MRFKPVSIMVFDESTWFKVRLSRSAARFLRTYLSSWPAHVINDSGPLDEYFLEPALKRSISARVHSCKHIVQPTASRTACILFHCNPTFNRVTFFLLYVYPHNEF